MFPPTSLSRVWAETTLTMAHRSSSLHCTPQSSSESCILIRVLRWDSRMFYSNKFYHCYSKSENFHFLTQTKMKLLFAQDEPGRGVGGGWWWVRGTSEYAFKNTSILKYFYQYAPYKQLIHGLWRYLFSCSITTSVSEIPQLLVIRGLSQDKGHLQPLFYSFLLNVINGLWKKQTLVSVRPLVVVFF